MINFIRHGRAGPVFGLTAMCVTQWSAACYVITATVQLPGCPVSTPREPYTMARAEWALGRQALKLQIQSIL